MPSRKKISFFLNLNCFLFYSMYISHTLPIIFLLYFTALFLFFLLTEICIMAFIVCSPYLSFSEFCLNLFIFSQWIFYGKTINNYIIHLFTSLSLLIHCIRLPPAAFHQDCPLQDVSELLTTKFYGKFFAYLTVPLGIIWILTFLSFLSAIFMIIIIILVTLHA